jgi:regulator of replication initiation timing
MLLRIALIIAVVASLAALLISHTMVATKISSLNDELTTTKSDLDNTRNSERQAREEAAKAKSEVQKLSSELSDVKSELETVTAKAKEQETLARSKIEELNKLTSQYNEAQRTLARWQVLGVTPEQVEEIKTTLAQLKKEKEVLLGENSVLLKNNNKLRDELAKYIGTNTVVEMPGLKAKVVAVDPKWEFVVLDAGSLQGAREQGILLVSRNGKLVGKIKITSVETNRCIANILPEWKISEIKEGDIAFY